MGKYIQGEGKAYGSVVEDRGMDQDFASILWSYLFAIQMCDREVGTVGSINQ